MLLNHEVLADREGTLRSIESVVANGLRGRGRLLVFEGGFGCGKSFLLAALGSRALDNGFQVLHARGSEFEAGFEYAVMRQLFENWLMQATEEERQAALVGPAEIVRELFENERPPDPSAREPILRGLHRLCVNLAERRPLLMLIDDLQWADAASLQVLNYLSVRLSKFPIIIGVATHSLGHGQSSDITRVLGGLSAVSLIPVTPLSRTGVRQLVGARLRVDVSDELVESCYTVTGGNPFYLTELLTELRSTDTAGAAFDELVPDIGPRPVAQRVLGMLEVLPDAKRELGVLIARALAALGPTAEYAQLAYVADLDPIVAAEGVSILMDLGIVHPDAPLRYVYPVVRKAVYEDTPRPLRHQSHLRAAKALETAGEPVEAIAAHLMAVPPSGNTWAAGVLSDAGSQALDRGDPESAVLLLRAALREVSPAAAEDFLRLMTSLGIAELRTRDPEALLHLRRVLDTTEDPAVRATVALNLSFALSTAGRHQEALELLQQTCEQAHGLDAVLIAQLRSEIIKIAQLTPQTRPIAVKELADSSAAGQPHGAGAAILAAQMTFEALIRGDSAEEVRALSAKVRGPLVSHPDGGAQAGWYVAFALACCDRLTEAVHTLDEAIETAEGHGLRLAGDDLRALRAWVHLQQGDLAEVDAETAVLFATSERTGTPLPGMSFATWALVDTLLLRDQPEAAAQVLKRSESRPPAAAENILQLPIDVARAHLRLTEGENDPAEARAGILDLQQIVKRLDQWGARCPAFTMPAELSVALSRHGRKKEGRELAESSLARAREFGAPRTTAAALRALALAGTNAAAPGVLEEAVDLMQHSTSQIDQCITLAELGAALRRTGHIVEARRHLRTANEMAESMGVVAFGKQVRSELTGMGVRIRNSLRTGVHSLTPSERRVGALAAEGKRNHEIAGSLFITVKTVEWHLNQVYRKLGITSRDELPRVLNGV